MLDLLGEIDTSLHNRLLRRLMNHMTKCGVPGVHKMIGRLDPALYEEEDLHANHGSNVPMPRRHQSEIVNVYQEIVRVASIALEENELNDLFKQWMRQAKLGYLAIATERRDVPLVEISQIVDRFCRRPGGGARPRPGRRHERAGGADPPLPHRQPEVHQHRQEPPFHL